MPTLPEDKQARLEELYRSVERETQTFVGYPCTRLFDYSELYRFLKFPINNVGDPYSPSTYRVNTKDIEREVLDWFADLTHADPNSFWGYITTAARKETCIGLYLARELMPDGLVYYSEDTHYSVSKNLLHAENAEHHDPFAAEWRNRLCGPAGNDPHSSRHSAHRHGEYRDHDEGSHRQHPHDPQPVPRNGDPTVLHPLRCGLGRHDPPVHRGGAAMGFRRGHRQPGDQRSQVHRFTDSLRHRPGQKSNVDRIARSIEYVGTLDTTVTGSRNGITPIFLWYAIHCYGREDLRRWPVGAWNWLDTPWTASGRWAWTPGEIPSR